jgi:hypothetical protein
MAKKTLPNGWSEIMPTPIPNDLCERDEYIFDDELKAWVERNDVMRGRGGICHIYQRTREGKKQFIMVTDDGHYYKVGASTMTWCGDGRPTWDGGTSDVTCFRGIANWSAAATKRTIKAMMEEAPIPRDPNYQT